MHVALKNKYRFCILIPTYMRNESLLRLVNSIVTFRERNLKPFVVICDNNPKNNIESELEGILGNDYLYIKNDTNLGARENIIQLLNIFKSIDRIDYAMIMTDDDYFIQSYTGFLSGKHEARHDMHVVNSFRKREEGSITNFTFTMLTMKFLYGEARVTEHIRVLSGCVLSKGLVKKYIEIVDNNKTIRSEMYPMLVWAIISNNTKYWSCAPIIHIVDNTMHWGEYDHCVEFVVNRLKTLHALLPALPEKSRRIKKIIKIFSIRIVGNKERYPCIKDAEMKKYNFFEFCFERVVSVFSFYLARFVSKIAVNYVKSK